MHARMEFPGRKHINEGAHACATLFNKMIPRMNGELPNRRRVSAEARKADCLKGRECRDAETGSFGIVDVFGQQHSLRRR